MRQQSADLLEKAKCYGAAVGLESGNQEIREVVIRKQSKNEHIVEGARLLREKRIKVLTTNMVGLPGETLDNALETVQLNMVLKSNYVRANTFLLFPGLPLVEYAKQKGYLDKDFDIEKHVAEATEITHQDAVRAGVQQHRRAVLAARQDAAAMDSPHQEDRDPARQRRLPDDRLIQHGPGAALLSRAADSGTALLQEHRPDDEQVAAEHDDAHVADAVQAEEGQAPSCRRSRFRSESWLFLMFTREEAGLLRQMSLLLKWGLVFVGMAGTALLVWYTF